MLSFIGEYEATLDAKGRFLLPAGLKKQLPENGGDEFIVNRGFETCLSLYPVKSWKPLYSKISELNQFDPKVRKFTREFLNGATELQLDNAGRLLLPKSLMDYAGLGKDIVLVSAVNKIEIWDKNKYKEFFDNFSPEAFSDLASIVMGGSDEPLKS